MLPRRSLRIRQLNSRSASTAIALRSATNATSKSTGNAAEKRTRTKIMAEADTSVNDVAVQPKLKKMKFNNDNNDPIAPFVLLPFEVLEQIFIKVDDTGLLNLADTCTRFESIALTVASKKYWDRYFVINGEQFGGDREIYEAIFNRFGIYIEAIEMNHISDIDAKHWTKMLRLHINHITKLTFDTCTFKRENIFSQIMHKITHLTVRNGIPNKAYNIDLLECRKLVRLDIRGINETLEGTLGQIMRNNPGLQSIHKNRLDAKVFGENSISNHLNQLKEVDQLYFDELTDIRPDAMGRMVRTLGNLESLGLNVHSKVIAPLQRLGSECKRIKRLMLRFDCPFRCDDKMIEAVRSFQQIEYLHLSGDCSTIDKIQLVVKNLPSLHHLSLDICDFYDVFPFADILTLLRECPPLETISFPAEYEERLSFISIQFFNDFLETIAAIRKPNARIEIKQHGKIIAVMNANGVVCRNKLIHWMGCDNIPESSNTHLLKLANELVKSDSVREQSQETVQRHLLNRIFGYLDVTSLYLFAETSQQSEQLVENYIETHSRQNGLFTITNEFYELDQYEGMHHMFGPHVTNLKIHNLEILHSEQKFLIYYDRLTNASIYDKEYTYWYVPESVRHLILDGSEFIDYLELFELLDQKFEKYIDILELKNASSFIDYKDGDHDGILKDSKVITLKFNYRGETQFKHFKKLFKGAKTKLVPFLPNSNHF